MSLLAQAMPFFLIVLLTIGFVLDGYAVFLRVAGTQGLAELLAMANLVQYFARILNVLVVFVMSLVFEIGHISSGIEYVFLFASVFGLGFVVCLIRFRFFCDFVTLCLRPFLAIPFPKIYKDSVWRRLEFAPGYFKLSFVSAATNALIVVAMFVPFGLAVHYPQIRMTAVYIGQLINFFATLLVFAVQDPISMRLVDGGSLQGAGAALLYGRVISYFLASSFFLFVLLV